ARRGEGLRPRDRRRCRGHRHRSPGGAAGSYRPGRLHLPHAAAGPAGRLRPGRQGPGHPHPNGSRGRHGQPEPPTRLVRGHL
ncbi:MAG: hypothetical protein AVDCRST_MAG76-609, partial [uncultured Acidimicrobiales bacterium]